MKSVLGVVTLGTISTRRRSGLSATRGMSGHRKIAMCKRTTMLTFALLVLMGAIPLLGACHTTAGAGEDISKTGQAIEKGANKLTPQSP